MPASDPRPLVVHVIHRLAVGGLENGLVNLLNGLPEDAFRHAIVCVEDSTDFRQRIRRTDVEVFEMRRGQVGVRRMRSELLRLFRRLKPDVLHTRNLSALDALLPARLAGVRRCVHGEHGRDANDPHGENRKLIWLRRLHRPLVTHYITVSKDLQGYLQRKVGVPAERITQIYNGVNTARFAPEGERLADLMPPAFGPDGRVLVGTVGRLDAVKDQASLVRAMAQLVTRRPDLRSMARLVIVGDGPLRAELHALAEGLGIGELVRFPGALDRVPDALRSLDVFVLPSLSEGISNTILEAMASGLPVLATAVGGNVELVDDGRTGRLFPSGDVPALVNLLEAYVSDAALRQGHGRAAREAALARFSMEAMMNGYAGVYRTLLAG